MKIVSLVIFLVSVFALGYAYVGYPLLVYLIGYFFRKDIEKSAFSPTITILITAYNEENVIQAKLENTLQIDYPKKQTRNYRCFGWIHG